MSIHEIAAASAAAIDSVHAEPVRLVPMIEDQHAGRVVDPSRPAVDIDAPLIIGSGLDALDTRSQSDAKRIGNGKALLDVRREIWPPETALRKGDSVIALARTGAPAFTVDFIDTRPMARVYVHLSGASHA